MSSNAQAFFSPPFATRKDFLSHMLLLRQICVQIGAPPAPPSSPPLMIKYPWAAAHSWEKLNLAHGTGKSSRSVITAAFSLKVSNLARAISFDSPTLDATVQYNNKTLLEIQPFTHLETSLRPTCDQFLFNIFFLYSFDIIQSSNVTREYSGASDMGRQAHTLISTLICYAVKNTAWGSNDELQGIFQAEHVVYSCTV